MSNDGHHHRKHRRRNPIGEFFDRLRGKKKHRSYHRSEFPGINLPKDFNPANYHHDDKEEKPSSDLAQTIYEDTGKDFSQSTPENRDQLRQGTMKPGSLKRKKSIFNILDLYFTPDIFFIKLFEAEEINQVFGEVAKNLYPDLKELFFVLFREYRF